MIFHILFRRAAHFRRRAAGSFSYFPLNLIKLENLQLLSDLLSRVRGVSIWAFGCFSNFSNFPRVFFDKMSNIFVCVYVRFLTILVIFSTISGYSHQTMCRFQWKWTAAYNFTRFSHFGHFERSKQLKWTIEAHFDFSIWLKADFLRFSFHFPFPTFHCILNVLTEEKPFSI